MVEGFAIVIGILKEKFIVKCCWCGIVNTCSNDRWNTCAKCFKDYYIQLDENSEIPIIK